MSPFTVTVLLMSNILLSSISVGANSDASCKLDAVILTTGKDSRTFEISIGSAMKHLVDVRNFYIISPNAEDFAKRMGPKLGDRVKFLGESGFPFNGANVSEVMIESVRQAGRYPLDGKSPFEKTVWGRIGWFLQQLLKFYAGKVIGLEDYILLDSDVMWFRDVKFVAVCNSTSRSYYYASSNQYHPPYVASLSRIAGSFLLCIC